MPELRFIPHNMCLSIQELEDCTGFWQVYQLLMRAIHKDTEIPSTQDLSQVKAAKYVNQTLQSLAFSNLYF